MAHFAEIDANNRVKRVIVVSNSDCGGGTYPGSDPIGAAFCNNLLGGTWKQTSYNSNFRKRYAGKGYEFDAVNDCFWAPQPYASWTKNTTTLEWEAPIAKPDGDYIWDEEAYQADNTQGWVAIEEAAE
jgi:hypothetical protein